MTYFWWTQLQDSYIKKSPTYFLCLKKNSTWDHQEFAGTSCSTVNDFSFISWRDSVFCWKESTTTFSMAVDFLGLFPSLPKTENEAATSGSDSNDTERDAQYIMQAEAEAETETYYGYVKSGNSKNPKHIPKKRQMTTSSSSPSPRRRLRLRFHLYLHRQTEHLAIKSKSEKCHTVPAAGATTRKKA